MIFQRIVAYVVLIIGKQSNTNLILNTILYGKREIKGQSMLQHVFIFRIHAELLNSENNIVPSDKTQEVFHEMQVHISLPNCAEHTTSSCTNIHTYTIHVIVVEQSHNLDRLYRHSPDTATMSNYCMKNWI